MERKKMKEAFINAMVTALEGGSDYWCVELGFYNKDRNHMSMEDWFENGHAIIASRYDDGVIIASRTQFFEDVNRLFPDWAEVFSDEGDYDAGDADQFLQFGMFGEIVYG
jgi:hypothetical protein